MKQASGRRPAQHVAASPRLRRREHVHERRRRTRTSSCSAAFLSWWMVVCVTALPTLCLGQERTEDGKERGANSTLAKKAEVWLPVVLVGCIALLVLVFCIRKTREARSRVQEEEAGGGDVEEAKDEHSLGGPVERISRPAMVWDKKPSGTAPFATASASGTSSSSYENASSSHSRSRSSERRHVSGALRSASKLPRYSSDRLQSPVHGGTVAAGGRRSGGRRVVQRGDAERAERVREGATGGGETLREGFGGGSSPPEAPRAHQDASIGDNSQEIYIVHQ